MSNIAGIWGQIATLDPTKHFIDMEVVRILIQTEQFEDIDDIIDVNFEGKKYKVRVKEEDKNGCQSNHPWWHRERENEKSPENSSEKSR